jgi:hypothetical protein
MSEPETMSLVKKALVGGAVGAGLAAAAPAATILAVNAVGFTAGGIAAGSAAASAMSAAAIVNGGAIAAGSSIAVLQGLGTVGLGTALGVGAIAAVPVIACAALRFGIAKTCISGLPNGTYDYTHGKWLVATEEGIHNVKMYYFESEEEARKCFNEIWVARVLYSPSGQVVETAGWNPWAIDTIKNVVTQRQEKKE